MRVEGEGGGRRAEDGGLMLEGGGLKVKLNMQTFFQD